LFLISYLYGQLTDVVFCLPCTQGWGKTPSTLLVECDDGEGKTETFEVKLWEYVQKETEAGLSPGSPCAVRGALSTRTGRGHLTLDKAQLVSGGGASILLFTFTFISIRAMQCD
jgi:hypothetical protein